MATLKCLQLKKAPSQTASQASKSDHWTQAPCSPVTMEVSLYLLHGSPAPLADGCLLAELPIHMGPHPPPILDLWFSVWEMKDYFTIVFLPFIRWTRVPEISYLYSCNLAFQTYF